MRTFQELNNLELSLIEETMNSYAGWVEKTQSKKDPFKLDVRSEPKFYIPSGEVYTGAWCRPQHDGPALRAFSLLMFAENLQKNGKDFSKLWNNNGGLIKTDLNFLLEHWTDSTCDLWEEIQSDNLFWNLMGYRHTLSRASQFARLNGETALADRCEETGRRIEQKIDSHWTGSYIFND
jgi:glucoamylase